MKINKQLNLVVPVETESGIYHIHATPISLEIFERYFRIIGMTFARLQDDGLIALGPKMAFLTLKEVATELNSWDSKDGVQLLINEIIRLSNVSIPSDNGWSSLPLDSAIKSGAFDDKDLQKIKGSLVFFTCISSIHDQSLVAATMNHMNGLWGLLTTSLGFMEYQTTLPTLTETGSSGETGAPLSIPS